MKGSLKKRCWCTDPKTKKRYQVGKCPKLSKKGHGAYYFRIDSAPLGEDGRRQIQFGPYKKKEEAEEALSQALSKSSGGAKTVDRRLTFSAYLDRWLEAKKDMKTWDDYNEIVDLYFRPALGHLRMSELASSHFETLVDHMKRINRPSAAEATDPELMKRLIAARADDTRKRLQPGEKRRKKSTRTLSAARIRRIMAVGDSALNHAVRTRVIENNPAQYVLRPRVGRQRPLVWTRARIARWRRTGHKPGKVMVWLPEHTGAFLDSALDDRLYALYHLVAFRGLRRSEVAGLAWSEVDLDEGWIMVREALTREAIDHDGEYETDDSDGTKTEAGERYVILDDITITVLKTWRAQQNQERLILGRGWTDSGMVFTRPDGRALRPDWLSIRFDTLVKQADLPPITFHGLRHGSATLALAAGVDMKVISETLGHSKASFTADTYTSVLPQLSKAAANATAAMVPRAGRHAGPAAAPSSITPPGVNPLYSAQ